MGLSIVDSVDTMIIMDLPRPFVKASAWIGSQLRCVSRVVVRAGCLRRGLLCLLRALSPSPLL
jgi:hypothetical protein